MPIDAQSAIGDVLLSHAHIDHVADLCFLLDNTFGRRKEPLRVWCLDETAEALETHLFNDKIWPNLVAGSFSGTPVLEIRRISPGEPFRLPQAAGEVEVTPVPVHHTVPTVGFILGGPDGGLLFTADTGPTEAIWEAGAEVSDLRCIITETSFPDELGEVARLSGHLTPALLQVELGKMPPEVPVYLYHAKPAHLETLRKQVQSLGEPRVRWLEQGKTYHFGH